jgi:hypothetical protein
VATPLIAYPFRVTPGGDVATVDEGSDEQLAQELAIAVLTRTGERTLAPTFGITDPTFVGIDEDALRLHVDLFGPPVDLEQVKVRFLTETTQDVVIYFSSD